MLLDLNGNPIQSSQLREPQTSKLASLHSEVANHHSRGLTPAKLARILEDAEQGNLQAQHELFIDMEDRDAHLLSEIGKRKRALLTLEWDIVPPRNASAAEKAAAAYAKELIQDMPDLEDLVFDLMDAVGHGFSALELQWLLDGREWIVQSASHRPQSWFQLDRDTRSQLRLRDNSPDGQALNPAGWIVHAHKAKSGYLARSGLHRVLSWPFLFKNYSVRDIAEFLEIYGLPLRVGKYPVNASPQEKMTLLRAVAGIGHDAAGIIPAEMEIEFVEAVKAGHEPFMAFIEWCEKSMSKAILGGTLTSQADGKTSTNALGNVHNDVRHDLLVSDARQINGTLTSQLVYPLLALNGKLGDGGLRRCPRFQFDVSEPEDMKLLADALPKLASAGAQIPVSYVNDKLKIPLPAAGEPVLGATKPAAPEPADATAAARLAVLTARLGPMAGRLDDSNADQLAVGEAAAALSADFQKVLGPRLDELIALLDETQDLALFRERLNELLAGRTEDVLVEALTAQNVSARLLGLFRGQR